MLLPNVLLRAVNIFGGLAVEKAVNKFIPVSFELLKTDTLATIGAGLIQAVVSEAVMTYVSDKFIDAFDGIQAPAPELVEIPQPEPQPAQQAPKPQPAPQAKAHKPTQQPVK